MCNILPYVHYLLLSGILLNKGLDIVFDRQRLKYAEEYVEALTSHEESYGVLFSGPNGVGTIKTNVSISYFYYLYQGKVLFA